LAITAHEIVVVGRDRGHPGEVLLGAHRVRDALQVRDQPGDGHVDTPLQEYRVGALADRLHALAHDRLREHRRRRGAVTDDVVGLDGRFLDQLGTHVLELVAQVDFARDGDAVVGDHGRAGDFLQDDVAPLGAERRLDRVGQLVHAREQQVAGFRAET